MAYNTIYTQKGEEATVDALDAAVVTYIHMGVGGTDAAKGDTALGSPWAGARVIATQTQPAADKWRHVAQLTADGPLAIIEAGLFDDLTAGLLWIRTNFAVINLVSGNILELTFDLEFA